MVKTQPVPGLLRTLRTPPFASTLRRQIDSPSPRADFSSACRQGPEHFLRVARTQAAAVVLHFDQDAINGGLNVQRDLGVLLRELERVLQQVSNRGENRSRSASTARLGSTAQTTSP